MPNVIAAPSTQDFTLVATNACRYLLQPLQRLRKDHDLGDDLFQYLFYDRENNKKSIALCIEKSSHITIVGNPGQGKSSLMHYMFIEFRKRGDVFPVILDYREITPHDVSGVLFEFVKQLRKYFEDMNLMCNEIRETTTLANCADHMATLTGYLQDISKAKLSKKLVIFLDDLDYAEEEYMTILKKYFLNYACSDKAVVVLSCRKPLLNNICKDDQLRQYYHIQPQNIDITECDLKLLICNRLKVLLEVSQKEPESLISRILRSFKKKTMDDILNDLIRKANGTDFDKFELCDFTRLLPFSDSFYPQLNSITYMNLRDIEQVFSDLILYQISRQSPSFDECFIGAFIKATNGMSNIMLDLTSEVTTSKKKKQTGNSILQNVLEYFYFHEIVDENFFEAMDHLGISKEMADRAINTLIKTPYSLFDPEYIYAINGDAVLYKRYLINNKGRTYVKDVLRNAHYYENGYHLRSTRSYYEEKSKL